MSDLLSKCTIWQPLQKCTSNVNTECRATSLFKRGGRDFTRQLRDKDIHSKKKFGTSLHLEFCVPYHINLPVYNGLKSTHYRYNYLEKKTDKSLGSDC